MNSTEIALAISLMLLGFAGIYAILLWFRQRNDYTSYQGYKRVRSEDDDPNN